MSQKSGQKRRQKRREHEKRLNQKPKGLTVERHDTEGVPIRLLKREKEMSDEDWKALLETVNRGDFPDWL